MVCIEEPTASAIVSLSSRGTNLKALGHCGLGLALQKPRHSKAAHLLQNAMVKTPGIAVGGHVHVLLIGTDVPKLRNGEYGGRNQDTVKAMKGLPTTAALLDYAGSEELAANLFRITQTAAALRRQQGKSETAATETHRRVSADVRQVIVSAGNTPPEDLPAASLKIDRLATQVKKKLNSGKK